MDRIRMVVVEDDESYVDVLRQVFARCPGFVLTKAYRGPVEFLGDLPSLACDVVLLDINMPRMSGLDCIGQIKQYAPRIRTLILTVHDDDDYILRAFLEGADGYLLKESTPSRIEEAIRDALQGGAPMSSSVARKVIRLLGELQPSGSVNAALRSSNVEKQLSKREYEILRMLADGKKYGEIAAELSIAFDTVKSHIRNIYLKLEVRNKAEAISRLLKVGGNRTRD